MSMIEGYNPETTEADTGGFSAIPAGEYKLVATEGEIKTTKAGTGSYAQFTNEIIEGEFKGRKIWTRFNTRNPNKQAQDIGHAQLKAFGTSVGNPNANEIPHFLNKPFLGSVTFKNDPKYGESNDVKKFTSISESQTSGSQTTEAGEKPSWAS